MKSLTTLPNHKFWPNRFGAALLAIDTGISPIEPSRPHLHMHFPESDCEILELGVTPGTTCTIFKVKPNEAISVTLWNSGIAHQFIFDVLHDLTLGIHDHRIASPSVIPRRHEKQENLRNETLTVDEKDVEILFSAEWPEWLQPTLEAQLRHWRIHHVEHFYHYSPWQMSRDDVWRCVKNFPSLALRRFGHILTDLQHEICCRKAPRAAAAYALNSLTPLARQRALREHPDEVLRHASYHLSDTELIELAQRRPLSVFQCCRCMPGKQGALALSVALTQGRGYFFDRVIISKEFLLKSLVEYPMEWRSGAGGSFKTIFTVWSHRLGIILSGLEMLEILCRIDSTHKSDFTKFVSLSI